jgi:putative ABC transport system permease protein
MKRHHLREFLTRARFLITGRAPAEVDEELQFHIDQAVAANIAGGMSESEARRQARIDFGGLQQSREATSSQHPGWFLDTVAQDLRYALRGFVRNPAFTLTILATLALAIGATTAVFSVVDRILFRSLPYADDDRLVSVGLAQSLEKQEFTLGGFFYEWQQNQRPFTSVTFERGTGPCNLSEANPVALNCGSVAQNFLPTLGIAPILGRNFTPEEDLPTGPRAVLITDALWKTRYNRSPQALNKTIHLDNEPVQIVGVLPRTFQLPRLQAADLILPARVDISAQHTVNNGIGIPMWAFARLKPGVSIEQARLQMQPVYEKTRAWIPAQIRNDFNFIMRSVRDRQMQQAYTTAWVLLGAAFAMLLIACANVAGLFLARGAARERELAVRAALGASRSRILRQTLTEAALLALAAAALGIGLAAGLLQLFLAIAPTGVPFLADARLDFRIGAFAVLIAFLCALLFGSLTFGSLAGLQKPNQAALASRSTKSKAHARLRSVLVVTQIAISLVLLSSASLLLKSFRNLEQQELGLKPGNVLTLQIPLTWQRYQDGQAILNFYLRVETALRRIPGVAAVGLSDSVPPSGDSWHNGIRYADILLPGQPPPSPTSGGSVIARAVTPGYFRVLQIPIVEGRNFTEQERTSPSHPIILSKLLAARLFPGKNPIGQQFRFAEYRPYLVMDGPLFTVVGIAANVKNAGLVGQDDPEYYTLRGGNPDAWSGHTVITLETDLPAAALAPWIRSQIAQIDPTLPVEINQLSQDVSKLADRPRFETTLFGFFALCGLVMAVIGLYGVIAYLAARRTQEIGIRMALGATRINILGIVAGQGLRLVTAGAVLGIAASLGFTRLLATRLFHVSPRDPLALTLVTILLAAVAMLATLIPARSATRTDPAEALRSE